MSDNYYDILEVQQTSSVDEIKKSYRRLSLLYHPDRNKGNSDATLKFQKINEAYETLSDPEKKREYDMTRNNPFFNMMNGGGSQHVHINVDDIFQNLFSGGAGNPFMNAGFGPGIQIFHNGVNINLQKPTPIITTIDVPINKILSGTTVPVDIERWIMQNNVRSTEKETIYVDIPKGMDEGEIIILRDKGNIAQNDNKGDVKIFIRIQNNSEFKRQGLDLILEKTITLKEALCGFSFEIKHLSGKGYTINNNSSTSIIYSGYQKVIPNLGFTRDQHVGNFIIIFNVKFPEKLDDKVLEQLKAIDF